ncbi:Hypothetical protein D9617_5g067700 [Elsinoe fawcettii]|nr:Hypothetical protein D9617_5g067700 [Elsinoe fawcettii]
MARLSDPVRAQEILNYLFQDVDLLREALQAAGASEPIRGRLIEDGNKRLALVGINAIIHSITLNSYQNGSSRAVISANIQPYVSQTTLANLTQRSNLDMCIATNPSHANDDIQPSLMADTLKAVLGALWIDCGGALNIWSPIAVSLGIAIYP